MPDPGPGTRGDGDRLMGDQEKSGLPSGPDHKQEAYRFRAGEFEGPLDLLLHLVRINEIEVTNIPILDIARQYDEYLNLMRELNLEIAGEYLVMAATLLHIKSQLLLPKDPEADQEEVVDPRAELTQQLLEYQRYKHAAENLQAMNSIRSLIWTRDGTIPEEFRHEELLTVDLFDLLSAFRGLLGRLDEEARLRLRRDNVSVAEKIGWLTDQLGHGRTVNIFELMKMLPTRLDRIAAFLALLEMIRLHLVVAFQRKALGEIRIALRREEIVPESGGGGRGE